MDYDDLKAWKKAHMMLMADKLLEACQFALGALETMSTQQFAQGGDHCVRAHLHEAIVSAGGQATIADRTEIFQKAINDSIRHNIERLT
ncbi:MAG TPA: hypothetical protein VMH05_23355 [Bryobacteraceae bacterium]|nr:hypothetical protein [Bryobacteraceae bacterium]